MNANVSLACGCTANAVDANDNPTCVIHGCKEIVEEPNLENREARCSCGNIVPSSVDLPFFEFRGEGSRLATTMCGICGMSDTAHRKQEHKFAASGHMFSPKGAFQYGGS